MFREYRVIEVKRYVITQYEESDDGRMRSSRCLCLCDSAPIAEEMKDALIRSDGYAGPHARVLHELNVSYHPGQDAMDDWLKRIHDDYIDPVGGYDEYFPPVKP